MLKIITHISRLVVAIVFIYSGFVKLVDPLGTKIKMLEYFSEDVLNMEFLIPYALPISLLLILAELILGVMLLVGYKSKLAVYGITALTTVFLFLTWYSHTYQVVTDCGCFGDAIKLTTGETFYKNIVFTLMNLIMIYGLRYIKPLVYEKIGALVTFVSFGLSVVLAFYTLNHLPIIDFRAYEVGTDMVAAMQVQEGEEFAKIQDFGIETADGNKISSVLQADKALLVLMNNINDANKSLFPNIAKVCKSAEQTGYTVYIVTDVPPQYMDVTPESLGLPFKFAGCDVKAMKTAIRANPGILTIEKGVIKGKWNANDAEDVVLK